MDRLDPLKNDLCIVAIHRFLAILLKVELVLVVLLLFVDLFHRQKKVMVLVGNMIFYIVRCEFFRVVVLCSC